MPLASIKCLFCLLVWLFGLAPLYALDKEISLGQRHIVLLNADLKTMYGTYFFAVSNKTKAPLKFKTLVMLPDKVTDFNAQDGLEPGDLKQDIDGKLYVEKEFRPGLSLVGVGFKIPIVKFGPDYLHFRTLFALEELSVAVAARSGLVLESAGFEVGLPAMLGTGVYEGIRSIGVLAKDADVKIRLSGIPKMRAWLEIVFVIAATLFSVLALFLAIRTQRSRTEK